MVEACAFLDFVPPPSAESVMIQSTLGKGRSLVVWAVIPDLEPEVDEAGFEAQMEFAVEAATQISRDIVVAHPCVSERYDRINPIIVDRRYRAWFSGSIAPGLLNGAQAAGGDGLLDLAGAYEVGYLLDTPPGMSAAASSPALEGACAWPDVLQGVGRHVDLIPGVEGLYLVVDKIGVNVWAQWIGERDFDREAPKLVQIAAELRCLHPAPDWLWYQVVDAGGRVHTLGRVPGEALRSPAYEQAVRAQAVTVHP
jgi:hypothetical protein